MSSALIIQLVAILIAMSCSLLGVFLVKRWLCWLMQLHIHSFIRNSSYIFFVHDMSSPILIVGASIVGVLTVYLVELC